MTTAAFNRDVVKASTPSQDAYADAPHSKFVMRQTQGVIGTVLLGGVAAAYFVSMTWMVIPVVIGLGLLVAGVSGVCPMASLIAHMPWNKAAEDDRRGSSGGCCSCS